MKEKDDIFLCPYCGKRVKKAWEEAGSHPYIAWRDILDSPICTFVAASRTKGNTGLFCDMECLKEFINKNYV